MKAILVSHSHWDREWHHTFQDFRSHLVDLVDHVLGRCDVLLSEYAEEISNQCRIRMLVHGVFLSRVINGWAGDRSAILESIRTAIDKLGIAVRCDIVSQ
jgi:hypothetical protein